MNGRQDQSQNNQEMDKYCQDLYKEQINFPVMLQSGVLGFVCKVGCSGLELKKISTPKN